MGATGSRSSTTETLLVNIPKYSKLVPVPPGIRNIDQISFRGIQWNLMLQQKRVEQEDGVDCYLTVKIKSENREPAFGIDVSIEILDETGEHTVFSAELCQGTWEEKHGCLHLGVYRRELEASSCVSRPDDITVRYTLKERPRRLFRNWPSLKPKEQLPALSVDPVAATHTLTIGNLSELRAALLSWQCAYSTYALRRRGQQMVPQFLPHAFGRAPIPREQRGRRYENDGRVQLHAGGGGERPVPQDNSHVRSC
jgi:hypothetical protein